jgi:NAD(P)-dependent dehydrogenase (short-subunit alcohol dehydrogenase family)
VNITTTFVNQAIAGIPTALANLTKGGLTSVTRELAVEYAEKGIRVNAVSPGFIKTPIHSPETFTTLANFNPMKRVGEVGDITDAVLYLEGAGFATGEVLYVDGGQNAGR